MTEPTELDLESHGFVRLTNLANEINKSANKTLLIYFVSSAIMLTAIFYQVHVESPQKLEAQICASVKHEHLKIECPEGE